MSKMKLKHRRHVHIKAYYSGISPILRGIVLMSLLLYLITHLLLFNMPTGASKLEVPAKIFQHLSGAVISSFIFYFLTQIYPKQRARSKAILFLANKLYFMNDEITYILKLFQNILAKNNMIWDFNLNANFVQSDFERFFRYLAEDQRKEPAIITDNEGFMRRVKHRVSKMQMLLNDILKYREIWDETLLARFTALENHMGQILQRQGFLPVDELYSLWLEWKHIREHSSKYYESNVHSFHEHARHENRQYRI